MCEPSPAQPSPAQPSPAQPRTSIHSAPVLQAGGCECVPAATDPAPSSTKQHQPQQGSRVAKFPRSPTTWSARRAGKRASKCWKKLWYRVSCSRAHTRKRTDFTAVARSSCGTECAAGNTHTRKRTDLTATGHQPQHSIQKPWGAVSCTRNSQARCTACCAHAHQ
jgi:hypothetical protein